MSFQAYLDNVEAKTGNRPTNSGPSRKGLADERGLARA
jgi:hypothetical protein